jgi:hypothetical protein
MHGMEGHAKARNGMARQAKEKQGNIRENITTLKKSNHYFKGG